MGGQDVDVDVEGFFVLFCFLTDHQKSSGELECPERVLDGKKKKPTHTHTIQSERLGHSTTFKHTACNLAAALDQVVPRSFRGRSEVTESYSLLIVRRA